MTGIVRLLHNTALLRRRPYFCEGYYIAATQWLPRIHGMYHGEDISLLENIRYNLKHPVCHINHQEAAGARRYLFL